MLSGLHAEYLTEGLAEDGNPLSFSLHCPPGFNFADDVVDRLGSETPETRACAGATTTASSATRPSLTAAQRPGRLVLPVPGHPQGRPRPAQPQEARAVLVGDHRVAQDRRGLGAGTRSRTRPSAGPGLDSRCCGSRADCPVRCARRGLQPSLVRSEVRDECSRVEARAGGDEAKTLIEGARRVPGFAAGAGPG